MRAGSGKMLLFARSIHGFAWKRSSDCDGASVAKSGNPDPSQLGSESASRCALSPLHGTSEIPNPMTHKNERRRWRAEGGPKIIPKEKPRSSRGWSKWRGLAYLASGRLVPAGARSNGRPRFGLYRFGPITSADCCERRKCVAAIFAVRDAPAHDEPHSGPNNSEREPTSGRSTKYGSGHLIRVFRDIGRISSLLFLLSHPSPVGHPLRRRVQKRKTLYGFVEGKNGFNCVSCGTHRAFRQKRTPPECCLLCHKGGVSVTLSRVPHELLL
jgi:hypothetical protein